MILGLWKHIWARSLVNNRCKSQGGCLIYLTSTLTFLCYRCKEIYELNSLSGYLETSSPSYFHLSLNKLFKNSVKKDMIILTHLFRDSKEKQLGG